MISKTPTSAPSCSTRLPTRQWPVWYYLVLLNDESSGAAMCSLCSVLFWWHDKISASSSRRSLDMDKQFFDFFWFPLFFEQYRSLLNVIYSIFYWQEYFPNFCELLREDRRFLWTDFNGESMIKWSKSKFAQELPAIEKQNGRYQCFLCGSLIDQKRGSFRVKRYCIVEPVSNWEYPEWSKLMLLMQQDFLKEKRC